MIELMVLSAALSLQEPAAKSPPADDDAAVPGLPAGKIPPLPDRVKWNLDDAVTERTSTRERISLAGHWRFAAVDNATAPVKRSDMGWINMPFSPGGIGGPHVFDQRFRAADGMWRGKAIDRYEFVWAERDLAISGAQGTLKWLNRRSFLVLRGPWANAEIFTSQRLPRPDVADAKSDGDDAFVHAEPVSGIQRDGFLWCEVSEQLIYPGTTQISMRLKQNTEPDAELAQPPAPDGYVGLELMPTGPRIESIDIRRDADKAELELAFALVRPKGFMLFPGPPVRTIPMTLKVRLDDATNEMILTRRDEDIGPIADNERTVKIRVPWNAAHGSIARVALHARLMETDGRTFDHAFPVEFKPDALKSVE